MRFFSLAHYCLTETFVPVLLKYDLKKESMKIVSYERRDSESVDDMSLSYATSQNVKIKSFQIVIGYEQELFIVENIHH